MMKAIIAFIFIVLARHTTASLASLDSSIDHSSSEDNFALQLLLEFEQRYRYQLKDQYDGTRRINTSDDFVPTTPAIFVDLCKGYHLSNEVVNDDQITSIEAAAFFEFLCDELDHDSDHCKTKTDPFTSLYIKVQLAFIDFICPKTDPNSAQCIAEQREKNKNSEPLQYAIEANKDLNQDVEDYCVALYAVSYHYHRGTHAPTLAPSARPSMSPSVYPSAQPSMSPSDLPSMSPSARPSMSPSMSPAPTLSPTAIPTKFPTAIPTKFPTAIPTKSPTKFPTAIPTKSPTKFPTKSPTKFPTRSPTISPRPTESFEYTREFTYMMGFDDLDALYSVLYSDATGIKDSTSDAIVKVLTERSPSVVRSLDSSKYYSESSDEIFKREEKENNQSRNLEFLTLSTGRDRVEHVLLQLSTCTSEFVYSKYCNVMVSKVTLKSSKNEMTPQFVDEAVFPHIKSSMSDTSFRDTVNRIEVLEVKYINDGYDPPTISDPDPSPTGIGIGTALAISLGFTLPILLCLLFICVWRKRGKSDDKSSIESDSVDPIDEFWKDSAISEESVTGVGYTFDDEFEDNYNFDPWEKL